MWELELQTLLSSSLFFDTQGFLISKCWRPSESRHYVPIPAPARRLAASLLPSPPWEVLSPVCTTRHWRHTGKLSCLSQNLYGQSRDTGTTNKISETKPSSWGPDLIMCTSSKSSLQWLSFLASVPAVLPSQIHDFFPLHTHYYFSHDIISPRNPIFLPRSPMNQSSLHSFSFCSYLTISPLYLKLLSRGLHFPVSISVHPLCLHSYPLEFCSQQFTKTIPSIFLNAKVQFFLYPKTEKQCLIVTLLLEKFSSLSFQDGSPT